MQRYTVFFITVNALHVSGGETAWNIYSIDSNKEYCMTLHLVGYTKKSTLTMHGPMNVKFTWQGDVLPCTNVQNIGPQHLTLISLKMNGPAATGFNDTCPTPATQLVTESTMFQQISNSLYA